MLLKCYFNYTKNFKYFFQNFARKYFCDRVSCSWYLNSLLYDLISSTKTDIISRVIFIDMYISLQSTNFETPWRSLTLFNNFFATKFRRINRYSFVIVSECNQRRGSILREFFTTIRTTMINRYFILFGMPVVSASKEGSC